MQDNYHKYMATKRQEEVRLTENKIILFAGLNECK